MFTGIIQTLGTVTALSPQGQDLILTLGIPEWTPVIGESIAVNGVCLTVTPTSEGFRFFASQETLSKTNLGTLKTGMTVNLERALKVGDSLSGHMVQGHVDATGLITALEPVAGSLQMVLEIPKDFEGYCVTKGSLTVDGVSLTINEIRDHKVFINLIPHTLTHTTFQDRRSGDVVNLEFDVLAKYISNYLKEAPWRPLMPTSSAP